MCVHSDFFYNAGASLPSKSVIDDHSKQICTEFFLELGFQV